MGDAKIKSSKYHFIASLIQTEVLRIRNLHSFFFSITFEVFIVTPSNFVTFPNFYLSLLWEKKFWKICRSVALATTFCQ